MNRQYCTYFDHRYLPRGLAMIRSLRRVVPDAQVWVLCLSDAAAAYLTQYRELGVRPVTLAQFEAGDEPLLAAKRDGRSTVEYYFTCTPSLILYVLNAAPDADTVTYLDADVWFFASPDPVYDEAGSDSSIIIIPHRFPPAFTDNLKFGKFNVGWVTFRRDTEGLAVLEWWRARCLEWCCDYLDEENNRFADQLYLDRFPALSSRTHVVSHTGANLAPWNIAGHHLRERDGRVFVDGRSQLLFFHFHGVKPINSNTFLTGLQVYRVRPDRVTRMMIYRPYLEELRRTEREVVRAATSAADTPLRQLDRSAKDSLIEKLKTSLKLMRALFERSLIRIPK